MSSNHVHENYRSTSNNGVFQHKVVRFVGLLVFLVMVLIPLKVSTNNGLLPSFSGGAEQLFNSPSLFLNNIANSGSYYTGDANNIKNQAARRAELVTKSHQLAEHLQGLQKQQQRQIDEASTTSTDEASSSTASKKKPLNILILYPDDWRHDSIGGVAPVVQTPFLNQLAREGIRFTYNMVTTSICLISRATLFTGQYASRHRSYRLRTPVFYDQWNKTSWPALLQQHPTHPYYTGHVGKWQYANPNRIVQTQLFNYTNIFEGQH